MTRAPDFGLADQDYADHRQGFPQEFFQRALPILKKAPGKKLLDLGTGTGTLARGFAGHGFQVTGLDPSERLLLQGRRLAQEAGLDMSCLKGQAETIPVAESEVQVVTAGQCWHWFNGPQAAREVYRVLQPGGLVLVAHFDWAAWSGNLAWCTEQLILKHNPNWAWGGLSGLHDEAILPLKAAGFEELTSQSFELDVPYNPAGWRGRIRASAGIGASLDTNQIKAFDEEHRDMLARQFPGEKLLIPHRVFLLSAWAPS